MPRNQQRRRFAGAAVEQQQQQQQQEQTEPTPELMVPTPPGAQDTLAYLQGRLQEAESDYAIVTRDLAILKREWRLAHNKRAQLRNMERSAMLRMGLDTSSLPYDWSYEPSPASSDPEDKDKEDGPPDDLEDGTADTSGHDGYHAECMDELGEDPPRPSKAPRVTSASRPFEGPGAL